MTARGRGLTGIRTGDETAEAAQRLLCEYHAELIAVERRMGCAAHYAKSRIDQATCYRLLGAISAMHALLDAVTEVQL